MGEEAGKKSRLLYIDVAKGIGIILVVFGHLLFSTKRFSDLMFLRNYIYAFHMPLFFVISGFCLSGKYHTLEWPMSMGRSLKRICVKLLPCYFVWSFIYISIYAVTDTAEDIQTRIMITLTTRGLAPLWFLITLFFCQVMFTVFYRFFRRKTAVYGIVTALIFAGTIAGSCWFNAHIRTKGSFYISGICCNDFVIAAMRLFACLGMVFVGYFCEKIFCELKPGKGTSFFIRIACLCALGAVVGKTDNYVNLHLFQIGNPVVFILGAILGSVGVLMLAYAIEKIGEGLAVFGRHSLGIMLLHYKPFVLMRHAGDIAFAITSNVWAAMGIAVTVVLGVCGGLLFAVRRGLYIIRPEGKHRDKKVKQNCEETVKP